MSRMLDNQIKQNKIYDTRAVVDNGSISGASTDFRVHPSFRPLPNGMMCFCLTLCLSAHRLIVCLSFVSVSNFRLQITALTAQPELWLRLVSVFVLC